MPFQLLKNQYNIKIKNILIILLLIASCDEGLETSVFDQDADTYEEPETTIVSGPDEGSTITVNSATFSFSGNELVTEYSYSIVYESNEAIWSDWISDSSVTVNNLDEGYYTFYVSGRYITEDEDSTPAERSFYVDAVSGPSVRVFPQESNITANSVFNIDIYAEEVNQLAGIELELQYDSQKIEYRNIEKGQFLSDYSGTNIFIDEHTTGNLTITIGIAEDNGNAGLTGTGILFSISFNANQISSSSLVIYSASFRDAANDNISTNQQINGIINVIQ